MEILLWFYGNGREFEGPSPKSSLIILFSVIASAGKEFSTEIVNKDDTIKYLIQNFSEEISEFEENYLLEELADILEIVHGLAYHLDYSLKDLETVRKTKAQARGGFEKSIVLKKVW